MTPKLTIITPVYNSIAFIEKCIKNVIDQNCCEDLEHLIIDAGSNDGTLDIIKSYADKYPHIRYISEPDNGQSDAMNKGIKLAKGQHIGFLNADDFYTPYTLKRILALLNRKKTPTIIVGNCKIINTDGDLIYINRPERLKPYHLYAKAPFPINPVAYFYNKSIHDDSKVGFYNTENHYNMDYEFFLKVCIYYPIVYHNEDWGFMIDHPDAKTHGDSSNNLLQKRKDDLFNFYYGNISFLMKIKVFIYKAMKYRVH